MINLEDIPQEAVDAFNDAWNAKLEDIGSNNVEEGILTRAGIAAVLNKLNEISVAELQAEIDRKNQVIPAEPERLETDIPRVENPDFFGDGETDDLPSAVVDG